MRKALHVAETNRLEAMEISSTPTALLAHAYVSAHSKRGTSRKLVDFNLAANLLYRQKAQEILDRKIARTFLDLMDEKLLPSWAIGYADLDLIRAAAGE